MDKKAGVFDVREEKQIKDIFSGLRGVLEAARDERRDAPSRSTLAAVQLSSPKGRDQTADDAYI